MFPASQLTGLTDAFGPDFEGTIFAPSDKGFESLTTLVTDLGLASSLEDPTIVAEVLVRGWELFPPPLPCYQPCCLDCLPGLLTMAPNAWPFEHVVNIDSNLNRLVSMACSPTLQCPPVPHAQKYHVLNTTVKAADLEEGLTVETLAGVPLTVSWRWVFVACLSLSCAPVLCESLFCLQGRFHTCSN